MPMPSAIPLPDTDVALFLRRNNVSLAQFTSRVQDTALRCLHVPGLSPPKYAGALAALLLLHPSKERVGVGVGDAAPSPPSLPLSPDTDMLGLFLQSRSSWLAAALKSGQSKLAVGTSSERLAANTDAIVTSLSAILKG